MAARKAKPHCVGFASKLEVFGTFPPQKWGGKWDLPPVLMRGAGIPKGQRFGGMSPWYLLSKLLMGFWRQVICSSCPNTISTFLYHLSDGNLASRPHQEQMLRLGRESIHLSCPAA